ncbi:MULTISPECIES: hypothetical protein [unclassified Granulicatella]|uniref:hypothetical protein n=1 Tax=unclassified Granulicatella TaxID=2630493 RepID=UPI001D16F9A3|nr:MULTISPECIES: hypothetical protein [unclassified Granulicatella]
MKKILALLAIVVLFIGGCNMMNKKETLTKEQQDNVVKNIAKNYDIKSVDFISFSKDKNTGTYHLLFRINDNSVQTGLSANKIEEYGTSMDIGLSPVEDFEYLKRRNPVDYGNIDVSKIGIKYLKN